MTVIEAPTKQDEPHHTDAPSGLLAPIKPWRSIGDCAEKIVSGLARRRARNEQAQSGEGERAP